MNLSKAEAYVKFREITLRLIHIRRKLDDPNICKETANKICKEIEKREEELEICKQILNPRKLSKRADFYAKKLNVSVDTIRILERRGVPVSEKSLRYFLETYHGKVYLHGTTCGNPDKGQDPAAPLWGVDRLEVLLPKDSELIRSTLRTWIEDNDIGSGNLRDAYLVDLTTNKKIADVAYNGRLCPPNHAWNDYTELTIVDGEFVEVEEEPA